MSAPLDRRALATPAGSTAPNPSRAISIYNRLATNQPLTLPNAIATPPTVAVAGTSPYVTINSNWVVESPYGNTWILTFTPASGNVSEVRVSGSSGYFGSGPVQLNIPTFGAGFNAAHGMLPGILVNWTFFAAGGTLYSGGPGRRSYWQLRDGGRILHTVALGGWPRQTDAVSGSQ